MIIEVKATNIARGKTGKITKILVEKSNAVKAGDALFEIETAKGVAAVKAGSAGVITEILVAVGDAASADTVLAKLEGAAVAAPVKAAATPAIGTFDYFGGLLKPVKKELEADIAILGGGPGGYVAAIRAAQLGAKTVLIEKEAVGGTCLNRGCIPTKCFARSAQVYNDIKRAAEFGIDVGVPVVRIADVVRRKNAVVEQLTGGVKFLLQKRGVSVVDGVGKIINANTLSVKGKNTETTVKAKHIIIATGSKPAMLPIPGIEHPCVINSDAALNLDKLPYSMAIIGGGVIGMEFAFIFAAFGVKVTVIEYFDRCLNICDEDVSELIARKAALYITALCL
ncbi:FAD-dependent oxidoreductase [Sporomusa carbonis]|uniref:FAD-dependent oxidoreductase n=1 Tax=Sporomusa carbonis TaxID=3076075 RepID=UPI003C7D0B76